MSIKLPGQIAVENGLVVGTLHPLMSPRLAWLYDYRGNEITEFTQLDTTLTHLVQGQLAGVTTTPQLLNSIANVEDASVYHPNPNQFSGTTAFSASNAGTLAAGQNAVFSFYGRLATSGISGVYFGNSGTSDALGFGASGFHVRNMDDGTNTVACTIDPAKWDPAATADNVNYLFTAIWDQTNDLFRLVVDGAAEQTVDISSITGDIGALDECVLSSLHIRFGYLSFLTTLPDLDELYVALEESRKHMAKYDEIAIPASLVV
jgi:hypothetical protein